MSHAAFWKSICAEPDDDTPRLVYADWLDEQGDAAAVAKAEFIRAQVELAHLEPWAERAVELKVRARWLLSEQRLAWLAELPKWAAQHYVRFVRGFPYSQHLTAAALAKNVANLAKNTVVQDVTLSGANLAAANKLAASAHLARIRAVEIGAFDAAHAVLSSPHLAGLREWRFGPGRTDSLAAKEFGRLLCLPAVRGVSRLAVSLGRAEDLQALAETPFTNLRQLRMLVFAWSSAAVANVVRSPVFDKLTAYEGFLDENVFEALAHSRERPALKAVDFSVQGREQGWLEWGFAAPLVRHVVALRMTGLRDEAFRALVASPIAEQLRVLDLPAGAISPAAFSAGLATGRLRNLLSLAPGLSSLGGSDRSALDAPGLENLRHLDLSGIRPVVRAALDALASSKHFPNLRAVTVPHEVARNGLYGFDDLQKFAKKYAKRFTVLAPE